MRTGYGVETVRAAERALMARLPDDVLMRRAAAGLAAACSRLLRRTSGARVVLLVGSGDNGGDALYAGARLARRGAGVTAVLLAPERAHEGGLAALRAAGGRTVAAPGAVVEGAPEPVGGLIGRADLVVDGIVGIGGKGGLRPAAVELADLVRDAGVPVVAVDLPSGIDAETGEVPGTAVRADATVTFGAYKPGLLIDPAREHAGAARLIDIGLGPYLPGGASAEGSGAGSGSDAASGAGPDGGAGAGPAVEALQHRDVARLLPRPDVESDKYRRGVIGVVAGSARYPGAAVLTVAGALHSGAGAVRYAGPGADAVIARYPETLVSAGPPRKAGRVQAWVIGPGLGEEQEARQAVAEVLEADVPVLLDADGLHLMDRDAVRARTAPTVLTPHAGEAAALLGAARDQVEAARLASVRDLADRTASTVLLKGSTTLVAGPDSAAPVRVNATGTGWLATAGSGDVLSGFIGGLLAAGLTAHDAASTGAYVHGLAGRLAPEPPSALDVATALRHAWQDITT